MCCSVLQCVAVFCSVLQCVARLRKSRCGAVCEAYQWSDSKFLLTWGSWRFQLHHLKFASKQSWSHCGSRLSAIKPAHSEPRYFTTSFWTKVDMANIRAISLISGCYFSSGKHIRWRKIIGFWKSLMVLDANKRPGTTLLNFSTLAFRGFNRAGRGPYKRLGTTFNLTLEPGILWVQSVLHPIQF